jgi:hypothetical protein
LALLALADEMIEYVAFVPIFCCSMDWKMPAAGTKE